MNEEDPKTEEEEKPTQDVPQAADVAGITEHSTQEVEQSDSAKDSAAQSNDQEEVRPHFSMIFLNFNSQIPMLLNKLKSELYR